MPRRKTYTIRCIVIRALDQSWHIPVATEFLFTLARMYAYDATAGAVWSAEATQAEELKTVAGLLEAATRAGIREIHEVGL